MAFHRCGVFAKAANDQCPSLPGQFNLTHPPVLRALLARNQTFFTSRSTATLMEPGVSQTFGPMVLTGSGSFVEEDFEDAEIRVAQLCLLDASGRVGNQRLKGFHENEPDMHAGGVLPTSGSLPIHFFSLTQIILMSI